MKQNDDAQCTDERNTGMQPQDPPAVPPAQDKIFTRAFVLMALVNLLVFVGWQMMLTGLPLYLDMLGADPVFIGLATTLATGAAVIVRPVSGVVVDRYGRKGVLVVGFAVMAVAIALYAVIPVAGVVLALRFIHGLGWGFGSTANSTLAADIIPRRRFAEAMGYFAMTNSLSLALAPALTIWLVDIGLSQIMIFAAAGFTVAALAVAIVLFVTDYEQPPLKNDIPLAKAFSPANMFERTAIFPSTVMLLIALGFGAISTFIALMGAERGIDGLALYFVVNAIANVVFRPIIGRWTDKFGFYWPGIMACLVFAASLVVIAFADALPAVVCAGVLVGLGTGTAMSAFQTMSVAIVAPTSRGAAMSTFLFLFNGGIAIGAFLAGWLLEPLGYTGMFLVMAVFGVLACIVFVCGGRERIDRYHTLQQR